MATTSSSSACRRLSIRALIATVALAAAGCVQITEQECRAANWYDLGEHDGNWYGIRPRIDLLAYHCNIQGVKTDEKAEKDYMAGWVDGYREWTRRVHSSDCCSR